MLACKTPSSLKKGAILYSFEGVSFDDDSSSVEAHEWHIRSIQTKSVYFSVCNTKILGHTRKATYVNLISKKKGVTWVKGDWAKYISKDYQNKFELQDRLPEGIYTTQLQAIKFAYEKHHEHIATSKAKLLEATKKKDIEKWTLYVVEYERELKYLKARLTKITNQKKKAKAA